MALSAQNASNIAPFESDQRNLPAFRSPPHNFEAEKALLGAILANNNAFDRVTDFLKSEHFADPVHGRIYDALARLILRNQIADPVTLRMFFEQDGSLADVGGARYLGELAASMVSIINVGDYGRLIYDLFIKRQLIDLGEQVVNRAYEPEIEAEEQISAAEAHLYELAEHGQMENGFIGFNLAVTEAINIAGAAHKRDGRLAGVGTGFRDIDEMLGGLHPSRIMQQPTTRSRKTRTAKTKLSAVRLSASSRSKCPRTNWRPVSFRNNPTSRRTRCAAASCPTRNSSA